MDQFDKLVEKVKEYYNHGDASHDFSHILRVIKNCKELSVNTDAQVKVLLTAALLHDVVNIPKNHPSRKEASKLAANKACLILDNFSYSSDEISKISTIILEHSFSLGMKPSCLESEILQDADRLDALGAIGIMRTISCGAQFKAKYYSNEDPFSVDRELDDKKYTIDHFYKKLFKLPELMNTQKAKEEAILRRDYMTLFLEQLKMEITSV